MCSSWDKEGLEMITKNAKTLMPCMKKKKKQKNNLFKVYYKLSRASSQFCEKVSRETV